MYDSLGADKTKFISGPAILHGKKYEDVAILIYENRTNLKVFSDYGCIRHNHFNFIGASPDGITENGDVIEIKCTYSRILTSFPKETYYDQMQLQMEVFRLHQCLFLECEIKEYDTYNDYKLDVYIDQNGNQNEYYTTHKKEKGVLFKIITNDLNNPIKYIYPNHLKMNHKEIKLWTSSICTVSAAIFPFLPALCQLPSAIQAAPVS